MDSIRKPKRIVIRGHDEREYPFLVKGGEDLRQDQRIGQVFEVMNVILSQDAACSQRNMQLKTYHVIPMTSRYNPTHNILLEHIDRDGSSNTRPNPVYFYWDRVGGHLTIQGFRFHKELNKTSKYLCNTILM